MEQCMALYDYLANQDEELTIRKNEKLTLLDSSKTWWRVQNAAGSVGYVPSNYCKKIDPPAPAPAPAPVQVQQPAAQIKHSSVKDDPGMYQQVDMSFNKKPTKVVAIVKYPYAATRDDELTLNKGDQVTVLEKEGDGWWNGEVNGNCGWFPSNYVEEMEIPDPTPDPATNSGPAEPTVICRVRALYAFQSGNHEELSFERGNMMDIIDQPENDPDWWEARKSDGSTGLVPRNYVEVVHDDPTPSVTRPPLPGSTGKPSNVGGGSSSSSIGGGGGVGGGMKPQLPTSVRSFENRPWFHGKMSRSQCEVLLSRGRDGDFLVRESESKAGDYSISMKSPGRIKHFRIQSLPGGQYGIGPRKFSQIEDLVDHYTKAHIYTAEDGTRMYLQRAFPKY